MAQVGEELPQNTSPVEAPLGIFQARCDDKGRLKLPANFVEYLKALNVDKVFITSVDMKLARIYPKKVWESNRNFFGSAGENAKIAQDVAFIANLYGAESEIDGQGRVLVPTELRRKLEMEAAQVWIDFYNDRINVYPKKVYEERVQRAMVGLEGKVELLESKGFK
jgi:MraZ protein